MAAVTDPQVIGFVNNMARKYADALFSALMTSPSLLVAWNNGISALVPNDGSIIVDGASVNGIDATGGDQRRVVTGADLTNLMTRSIEMDRYRDHGSLVVATTNVATLNTIAKLSVNGKPLF